MITIYAMVHIVYKLSIKHSTPKDLKATILVNFLLTKD